MSYNTICLVLKKWRILLEEIPYCPQFLGAKVIYPKYYKNSNESCSFLFWGRLDRQEMSAILLKYRAFLGYCSYFQGQNKYKIRLSVKIF